MIRSIPFALLLLLLPTVAVVAQQDTPSLQPMSQDNTQNAEAPQQPRSAQPGQPQRQPGQPPAARQRQETVVATVNDEAITQAELQLQFQTTVQALRQREPAQQQQFTPQELQELRQQVLDGLIESRLVEQFVRKNGPDVDSQEIDQVLDRVRQQLQAEGQTLQQYLVARNQTADDLRNRIQGSIAWQQFQQEQMTPEKLESIYQAERQRFGDASMQEVQPQLVQLFTAKLWEDIVEQAKPNAKIRVVEPQAENPQRQPRQPVMPPRR